MLFGIVHVLGWCMFFCLSFMFASTEEHLSLLQPLLQSDVVDRVPRRRSSGGGSPSELDTIPENVQVQETQAVQRHRRPALRLLVPPGHHEVVHRRVRSVGVGGSFSDGTRVAGAMAAIRTSPHEVSIVVNRAGREHRRCSVPILTAVPLDISGHAGGLHGGLRALEDTVQLDFSVWDPEFPQEQYREFTQSQLLLKLLQQRSMYAQAQEQLKSHSRSLRDLNERLSRGRCQKAVAVATIVALLGGLIVSIVQLVR